MPRVGVRLSYDSATGNVNEVSFNEMSGNILDFHYLHPVKEIIQRAASNS